MTSRGRRILLVLGIILMLPGCCSLIVMIATHGARGDAVQSIIIAFWVLTYIVAALGLILVLIGRAPRQGPGDA